MRVVCYIAEQKIIAMSVVHPRTIVVVIAADEAEFKTHGVEVQAVLRFESYRAAAAAHGQIQRHQARD